MFVIKKSSKRVLQSTKHSLFPGSFFIHVCESRDNRIFPNKRLGLIFLTVHRPKVFCFYFSNDDLHSLNLTILDTSDAYMQQPVKLLRY